MWSTMCTLQGDGRHTDRKHRMPSMHFFEHRLEVRHILAIAAFRRPANNHRVHLFLSFPLDFWILRHNEDEGEDRRDGLLQR